MGRLEKSEMSYGAGVGFGMAAGFTSTLVHAGYPPLSMYLLPQRLPRKIFVGTVIIFITVVNLAKLIPYGLLGLLRVGNLTTVLVLLPLAFLGTRIGVWMNGRFSEVWFSRFVYILLFLTGIQLILGQSLIGLFSQ